MTDSLVPMVTIAKIPGALHDVQLEGPNQTIRQLFAKLQIAVDRCEIQQNGDTVDLDALAQPGATILAIVKIRGN